MVRFHAHKSQWLALLMAVDDPLVSAEDFVVGMVLSDVDALIAGIFFKGFSSFDCLVGGCCILQVSESETRDVVNIDCCIFVVLGRQDPRHLRDYPWG